MPRTRRRRLRLRRAPEHAADAFRADALALADAYDREGAAAVAARVRPPPRAARPCVAATPPPTPSTCAILAEHDPVGAALTMRGVQAARPSLFDLRAELATMSVPTLLVVGDEDAEALDANLMLRGTLPDAGLAVLPRAGHLTNLEDPRLFDHLVRTFVAGLEGSSTG